MKYLIFYCLIYIAVQSSHAQTQGLVVQAGLTSAFSKDKNITRSGEGHYGWMVGGDARILEGGMYFIIGGQYHQTSLIRQLRLIFSKMTGKF
jgi:hypothetical protein